MKLEKTKFDKIGIFIICLFVAFFMSMVLTYLVNLITHYFFTDVVFEHFPNYSWFFVVLGTTMLSTRIYKLKS